jgi:hypothetical protein
MGRFSATSRAELALLLGVAACHSGQRLDWGDFEPSSAASGTRDVGATEVPRMEPAQPDPGRGAGVALERPLPNLPELATPEPAAPIEASDGGAADGKGDPDAGGYGPGAPSSDGGAKEVDAGAAPDGGNDQDTDAGPPPPSATQVCPAPGGGPQEARVLPDGVAGLCWVGESYATGLARAAGSLAIDDRFVVVRAYLFGGAASAKTQVYDADGNPLRGCVAIDTTSSDGQWREIAFDHEACSGAAFARVTAHVSPEGDL